MNTLLKMKIVFPSPVADERRVTIQPPPAQPTSSGGSTDPREFIALMARQKRREARIRRWKRVGLAVTVTGAVGGWFLLGRPGFEPTAEPAVQAAAVPAVAPQAEAMVAPAPEPVPAPLPEPPPLPARGLAEPAAAEALAVAAPVAPTEAAPVAPTEAAPPADASLVTPLKHTPVPSSLSAVAQPGASACETEFGERRWRAAAETCEAAFNLSPTADTALRVAHANYARGRVRHAGKWAATAVALGTEDADAYVLIGHSERRAGHRQEAVAAYRRYLDASPNGWHARHVRSALRALQGRAVSRGQSAPAGTSALEPPPLQAVVR